MRRQNFVTGAIILMIANAVSKILGAVFKIPLTYILHEDGMAIYNTAFEVYIVFLSFIISGFPFSVSKGVAQSLSLNDNKKAFAIVRVSSEMMFILGGLGSLILYFFAPYFAIAMKEESAAGAIQAISLSVFFVALGSPFKSYFQGASDMVPVAVSQVVEAIIKLLVGYALALYFCNISLNLAVSGAISGVTVGEILATLMLFISYLLSKRKKKKFKFKRSEILKEILSVALPLLLVSVTSNALSLSQTALTRNSLLRAGLSADYARFLYGAYTGYALSVFHLPSGILATLGVTVLPVIAGAIAKNNYKMARNVTELSLKLTWILALPCFSIMYMLSREVLDTLFSNSASYLMLKLVAPCIIPVCISQIMSAIMHSAGKISTPFYIMCISSFLRLILTFILTQNENLNIYGAIIAFLISAYIGMIIEYIFIKKFLGLKFNIMEILIKPIISLAMMNACIYFIKAPVYEFINNSRVSFFVVTVISCLIYILFLFITKAVNIKEIRKMFKM